MTKKDFIKLLKSHTISYHDYYDYNIAYYIRRLKRMKNITSFIDFGCEFDSDGRCNGKGTSYILDKQCCCSSCGPKIGYLDFVLDKHAYYYARKYNKKTGFWRKGKGCILDRRMRSPVCVCYVCKVVPKELIQSLKALKLSIIDLQNKLLRYIYRNKKRDD